MLTITNTQVKKVMDIVEALVKGGVHLEDATKVDIITEAINKALKENQDHIDRENKRAAIAADEKQKEAVKASKLFGNPPPSGVTIVNNLSNDINSHFSIDISCLNGAHKSRTIIKKNQQVFVTMQNPITIELIQDIKNG